jgi:hypothetical protein
MWRKWNKGEKGKVKWMKQINEGKDKMNEKNKWS